MVKAGTGTSFGARYCMVAALVIVVVVVQAAEVQETAAECDPSQLRPCMGAINGEQKPTPDCCDELKRQVSCFCGYLQNPFLKPYIDSPNSKKVVSYCSITPPEC